MIDTLTPDIPAFAAAVRAQLSDLPTDDVDDLLDGLEADLADQAVDSGDAFVLPDAASYAAELRSAAGLPDRVEGPAPRVPVRDRLEGLRQEAAARIRSRAAGAWLLDLFVALRPVWWLVRGVALYATVALVLSTFLGGTQLFVDSPVAWVAALAAILLSIQWGRGRWVPSPGIRVLRSIVNVVTTIVAAIMLISAPTVVPQYFWAQPMGETFYVDNSQPGLVFDGSRVRNIFPYDADGNALTGVQLFDEQGRALTTIGTQGEDEAWQWDQYFFGGGGPVPAPAAGTGTRPSWNVFPLLESTTTNDWGEPTSGSAVAPVPPFVEAPSATYRTGSATGEVADGSPTPEPTAGVPTPTPTP